ncbi:MAG: ABC transporter substrate-binding protein [Actinomycetota bacterium]
MTATLRRLLAIALSATLVAAGCGGGDDATSSSEPDGSSTASAPADEGQPDRSDDDPAPSATAAPEPTATPEPTVDPAAVTFPRTVAHELGEFTQTEAPERVFIAASEILGEAAISLGVLPIGRLDWFGGAPDPVGDDYGIDALEAEVESLGPIFTPNAEQILGLQPDLIFMFAGFQDGIHETLGSTVNTVAIDSGADWPTILRTMADAMAIPERAEEVLAEYDARLAVLADGRLGSHYAGQRVAFVTPFLGFDPRLTSPEGLIADAFRSAGIETWDPSEGGLDGGENEAEAIVPFSKELAGDITADAVVVVLEGEGVDTPTREDFLADPVWTSIPAVAAGDFVIVTNNISANAGPITHYLFFDDLERAVIEAP